MLSFFVIRLQNLQTVIFLVNLHETPKQWAVAHENSPNTQKMANFLSCLLNMY
jgi:hypothetical protein